MKETIEISTITILKIIAIILGLVFVYLIKNILVMLFISVIIAAAVDALFDWLTRHKIKRGLAVAIVYIIAVALFAFVIYLIVPPLAAQVKMIATNLPDYISAMESKLRGFGGIFSAQNLQGILINLGNSLSASGGDIFAATINIFGGILSAFLVLVISIYLAVREQGIKKFVLSFVPPKSHDYAANLVDRILSKLGSWMRGQLVLMAIIGVMAYIGLAALGIKYALTLALLTGLLEIVPIIGPIISAVPGVIFAFLQSFGLAVLVAAFFYVIQELEKYLIVPFVMKKSVDMNPIPVIVAVLIGDQLNGIIGAIIAIPVAAIISIIFRDLMERRKMQD